MADDELKKLKRPELAKRLAEAQRENERLTAELAELRAKLDERQLDLVDAGSIAEASLKLNSVFETAQAAADQYLENIERLYRGRGELVREAQSKAQALVAQAKLDAQDQLAEVREEAETEAEQIRVAAKVAADEARNQARHYKEEADEAIRATIRAKGEASEIMKQAKEEAQGIIDQAAAEATEQAERTMEEAKRNAEACLAEATQKAKLRMDEAERVSRNFELATKVKCDNVMRRALEEARTYGGTLRLALQVLGITPDMAPELAKALASKAAAAPENEPGEAPALDAGTEDAASEPPAKAPEAIKEPAQGDEEPRASEAKHAVPDLDEAVNSARAAVAAALSSAKTAPATLDAESVAAMYPNSVEQL